MAHRSPQWLRDTIKAQEDHEAIVRDGHRVALSDALDDFNAADTCALTHFPGHENYAVERYLRCIAVLALNDYCARHEVGIPPVPRPDPTVDTRND